MPVADVDLSAIPYEFLTYQQKLTVDANRNGKTPLSNLIVGIMMMLISLVCILAYAFILQAIFRDKKLIKMTSYKIMFLLGIFDVLQCFPHFVTGIFTIFQTVWHPLLSKLLGAIATPSYIGYALLTLLLSFQRFLTLLSEQWEERLFSGNRIFVWLGLAILSWASFVTILCLPVVTMDFHPEWYAWGYDTNLPFFYPVQQCEMYFEIISIALAAFFYVLVILLLLHKRHHFTSSANHTAEVKILIQASTITIYAMILCVVWHNYEILLPENIWGYMGFNFMWICSSGVYPLTYIIVNRTIRDKIVSKRSLSSVPLSHNHLGDHRLRSTSIHPPR